MPGSERVEEAVSAAVSHALPHTEGAVADYIPTLAEADPGVLGVALAEVGGEVHERGDSRLEFSIQSISKAFVYALVCQELGHRAVHDRVGVNNTGLPFNSVMALELNDGHPMNPMVNAGALVTTSLVPGATPARQWDRIRRCLGAFCGRELEVYEETYRAESRTNGRNRAIAQLLASYGRLDGDAEAVVDVYTRQCSLAVTTRDLAVMGATLADGGVNPVTGQQVVPASVCRDTLAVLASTGLYERSGEWLFEIGLPGKSGVSGGILTVSPGKAGIAAFSPRLDAAGNSVRAQRVTAHLSRSLGLDVFASTAATTTEDHTHDQS
ncbi:glutaminase A [Actinomyces provencensis]|uniref:glutaminase A n=1 Tax=Actinomyces provencensis TaxID=1720198 RepID=UPI00096AA026|nr:glutaminase A [Actinomyces provencensis]